MEAKDCGFDDRLLEVNKTERSGLDPDKHSFYDWSEYEIGSTGVITVPYYFNPRPSRAVRSAVEAGLRYVEDHMSCIKFEQTQKDLNKRQLEMTIATKDICARGQRLKGEVSLAPYRIRPHTGELSSWNKRIYLKMDHAPCLRRHRRKDSIKKFTRWYKIFVHELFHAFGIAHTMRRTDRDDYIKLSDQTSRDPQFKKDALIPMPGGGKIPYECNSIMHYKPKSGNFKAVDPTTCKFNKKEPTDNDWKALEYNTCAKLKGFSG